MSTSRVAGWCSGILVEEVFGELKPNVILLCGSGIFTLPSPEDRDEPEVDGLRFEGDGREFESLLGPFLGSVERSKELV